MKPDTTCKTCRYEKRSLGTCKMYHEDERPKEKDGWFRCDWYHPTLWMIIKMWFKGWEWPYG
jgi:hypothetical protein